MNKKVVCFFTILFVCFISARCFNAQEAAFDVPEIAKEFSGETLTPENSSEIFSPTKIIGYVFSAISAAFGGKTAFISKIAVLLFAVYIIERLSETFSSEKLVAVMNFSVTAASAASLFLSLRSSADKAAEAFSQLSGFLGSVFPVFLSALATSGHASAATSGGAMLFFALDIVLAAVCTFLKPFSAAYICIGTVCGISDNVNIKTLSSFTRNFLIAAMGLALTVFGGVMSIQTTLAVTSDTLFKRTAKLAAGSFIPIFGGAVGESIESAFSSAAVLKNSIGVFGTSVVFLTLLPSLAELAADLAIVCIACGVCGFFGNERAMSFFSVVRDCAAIVFSAATICGMGLTIGISILVKI